MSQSVSRLLLPALAFCQFLVAVDYNIVLVALPSLGIELGMPSGALQWVVSAYALAFGGLLLLGGRVADVLGRRKGIVIGLIAFGVGSALAAGAIDPAMVLGGRVLQGAGGAFLTPAVLATIAVAFPEGPARYRALSVWAGAGAVGLALGSALGGALMAVFDWRSVFVLLVPLAAIATVGVLLSAPADPKTRRRPLDIAGGASSALGIAGIVYALAEWPQAGWSTAVAISSLGGLALLGFFFFWERRSPSPLLDFSLLRHRTLTGGVFAMILFMGSVATSYYVFTVFTQTVLGASALLTGIAFLPWGLVAMFGSTLARRMLTGLGVRGSLITSLLITATGTAGFATSLSPNTPLPVVVAWTLLLGIGQAMGFASLYAAAGTGIVDELQGVSSAVMSTTQQLGTALGLGGLVGIATLVSENAQGTTDETIAQGLQAASLAGAAGLLCAAIITALALRPIRRNTGLVL